jgi:hypothetical protein
MWQPGVPLVQPWCKLGGGPCKGFLALPHGWLRNLVRSLGSLSRDDTQTPSSSTMQLRHLPNDTAYLFQAVWVPRHGLARPPRASC